ncbi:MAG: L-histidine N(alpha)-methyltransferase, partial [Chloroflexota bacterium]
MSHRIEYTPQRGSKERQQGDDPEEVLRLALDGLSRPQKTLPSKLLYDERGSEIFDDICELDEYYLTRTEEALMEEHAPEMAATMGPGCLLIEYGAGSTTKVRTLLDQMESPAGFVPVDISGEHLLQAASRVQSDYPGVPVLPVVADFMQPFDVPESPCPVQRRVAFFPGSTIGNFARAEAEALLRRMAEQCGPGGGLLIGVDLDKDPETLLHAYDDAEGVTASFSLNLLRRLNREIGADFDVDGFRHRAVYNPEHSRIEISLVSQRPQDVHINGHRFHFDEGEGIL